MTIEDAKKELKQVEELEEQTWKEVQKAQKIVDEKAKQWLPYQLRKDKLKAFIEVSQ